MRRPVGLLLVGLGVLLLVAAPLLRWVVQPGLARTPDDLDTTTHLVAEDAVLMDAHTLAPITTDVQVDVRTRSRGAAAEDCPDHVALWTSETTTTAAGSIRSTGVEVIAMDDRSGENVDTCESFRIDGDGRLEDVERAGLGPKFPFGTEPRDHEVWDASLGATVTARFDGETEVDGLAVYEFTSSVPRTVVGSRKVPAGLLGVDSASYQEADEVYAAERTVLVEPHSGAVVDLRQHVVQALEPGDGRPDVPLMDAELRFTDEQRERALETARQGAMLGPMRTTYPLVLAGAGLALLLGGVFARRTHQNRREIGGGF